MVANHVLCQLSYTPWKFQISNFRDFENLKFQRMSTVTYQLGQTPLLKSQISEDVDGGLSARPDTPFEISNLKFEILIWWAWVDSNYRPHPYQGCALTN